MNNIYFYIDKKYYFQKEIFPKNIKNNKNKKI
jgi:hypothetical protein